MKTFNILKRKREPHQVQIDKKIGEGCYGYVYSLKNDNTAVLKHPKIAVRLFVRKNTHNQDSVALKISHDKNTTFESRILSTIPPHKNIIQHLGSDEHEDVLLVEKAQETLYALTKKINSITNIDTKKKVVLTLVHGMMSAINHLAKNDICHNDAHAENWMLGCDGNIKLIDFGMATTRDISGLMDPGAFRFIKHAQHFFATNHPLNVIQSLIVKTDCNQFNQFKFISSQIDAIKLNDDLARRSLNHNQAYNADNLCKATLNMLVSDRHFWSETFSPSELKNILTKN